MCFMLAIRTHDNKGALVFPVNVHYFQGLQNYRIAAQHPVSQQCDAISSH